MAVAVETRKGKVHSCRDTVLSVWERNPAERQAHIVTRWVIQESCWS
jgi:hypothetical protein